MKTLGRRGMDKARGRDRRKRKEGSGEDAGKVMGSRE